MRHFIRIPRPRSQGQQLPHQARKPCGRGYVRRRMEWRQGKPRPLKRSGFPFGGERYRSVEIGADVDGAQAQAVTGLNQLLPIAAADAGVDIEARADAPATVTPAPAAMKAVRGSGSGSQRSNAERSCGDQSEGNLAKHYLSPVKLARCRCCVPARLSQRPLRAFNGALNYCVSGVFRGTRDDVLPNERIVNSDLILRSPLLRASRRDEGGHHPSRRGLWPL